MRIDFEVPDEILHHLLDGVSMPRMARVRYDPPTAPALADVRQTVADQILRADNRSLVRAGERIAIGVGSRGIGQLPEIVSAMVEVLKELGAEPFIVPAMGSHGGATAVGQRQVLSHLGVTAERVGAAVESQMGTSTVGHTPQGVPVHIDALAAAADGIVFVARIKPHTAFRGEYESGLAKMIAIGLGKQAGAAITHARGFGHMARMVPDMARVALEASRIRFGLAVLENAHDEPYKIVAIAADQILDQEPALLDEAKRAMPRIPFDAFDVLVIDQIGKNISGDGADPNITGRYPTTFAHGGPSVNKQVVLDLANASNGNANGVGTADFTTARLARKMEFGQTYPNALTSTVSRPVALPMVLPSDRLAIAAALLTCNAVEAPPTLVRIQDTLHLAQFSISESLLQTAAHIQGLEIAGNVEDMSFDRNDDFSDLASADLSPRIASAARGDSW